MSLLALLAMGGEPRPFRMLLAAGGGSSGPDNQNEGGGGGAGGLIRVTNLIIPPGNYPVTIGVGGATPSPGGRDPPGNPGLNSIFGALYQAIGGGYGGAGDAVTDEPTPGGPGGSGGGGGAGNNLGPQPGGAGTPGQGFAGGVGGVGVKGGAGGGAGGQGIGGTANNHGGPGIWDDIDGTGRFYCCGAPMGASGLFRGKMPDGSIVNGVTPSLGSGGEAGQNGVLIIRYPGAPIATGGTITTVGGDTVHKFTADGFFNLAY